MVVSVDNTLLDLKNPSYSAKAEFINCLIYFTPHEEINIRNIFHVLVFQQVFVKIADCAIQSPDHDLAEP